MGAVTSGARMAQAQLEHLEAEGKLDDGLRYEILYGELVIRGVPLIRHERAVNLLMDHFRSWVRRHGGEVFAGAGVELGGHQLVPDLTFIGPDRAGNLDADGFHVPPDLVVEVTSPGTRSIDLHEKRGIYEGLGIGEYWVVDLDRGLVVVHRPGETGAYATTEVADGPVSTSLAPGLEVPVGEVVADQ